MMHFCHDDVFIYANSADPDEMPHYVAFHQHYVAFHQGLHY